MPSLRHIDRQRFRHHTQILDTNHFCGNLLKGNEHSCSAAYDEMTTSSTQDRPDFELRQQRLRKSVRRDLIFILVGAIACVLVAYVETNASDADVRLHVIQTASNNEVLSTENAYSCAQINSTHTSSKRRIIDAGFILTKPIHSYLARRRDVNDVLALGNSVLLIAPLAYVVYVTLWKGDFRLSFRLIATHLFRSLCGWFT